MTPHFQQLIEELQDADRALETAIDATGRSYDDNDAGLKAEAVVAAQKRLYAAAEDIMGHVEELDRRATEHVIWLADPVAQREAIAAE